MQSSASQDRSGSEAAHRTTCFDDRQRQGQTFAMLHILSDVVRLHKAVVVQLDDIFLHSKRPPTLTVLILVRERERESHSAARRGGVLPLRLHSLGPLNPDDVQQQKRQSTWQDRVVPKSFEHDASPLPVAHASNNQEEAYCCSFQANGLSSWCGSESTLVPCGAGESQTSFLVAGFWSLV